LFCRCCAASHADVARAHQQIKTHHTRGKIVPTVAPAK
jgi:hypothetical protein